MELADVLRNRGYSLGISGSHWIKCSNGYIYESRNNLWTIKIMMSQGTSCGCQPPIYKIIKEGLTLDDILSNEKYIGQCIA